MKQRSLSALLLSFLIAACSPVDPRGGNERDPPDEGEGGDGSAVALSGSEELLAAFDLDGALVLVRPTDASQVARRELALFGVATDLLLDSQRARLVVALEREEDTRFVEVPLEGDQLGAPELLARVTGRARIALVPEGLIVAADTDGARVRLLRNDGHPSPGRGLAPPRSWWWDGDTGRVVGLALPRGEEAVRFDLTVDAAGNLEVGGSGLGIIPDDARLVADDGVEWLLTLDREAGEIDVVGIEPGGGAHEGTARRLASSASEIEGAAAWPPGRLVIATNEPSSLIVTGIVAGEEIAVPLSARVPSGSPYGRRDLVTVDGAIFAATHGEVVALRGPAGAPLDVTVDPAFDGRDLRGPLASVTARVP